MGSVLLQGERPPAPEVDLRNGRSDGPLVNVETKTSPTPVKSGFLGSTRGSKAQVTNNVNSSLESTSLSSIRDERLNPTVVSRQRSHFYYVRMFLWS